MNCPVCARRRWRRISLALILAGVVAAYLGRQPLLSAAGRWLNVSAPLAAAVDYVMVLGGGASTRPFAAAEIVRTGLAEKVLIPRFEESPEVMDGVIPPEHEILRQALLESGVSADRILLLDSVADSTAREAKCLAGFLAEHPGSRVAVVTNDFHTRRTRLLFSRACRDQAADLRFIGAPTDDFDASNWWHFEDGVLMYLNEYVKLARDIF